MKKALPLITLFCYAVVVAGCIAHIICDVAPILSMLILFIALVVGVLVLMSLSTASAIKSIREMLSEKKEAVAFEGLSLKEDTQTQDSPYAEDVTGSVASVFATEKADEKATEETAEAEATEETAEAPAEEPSEETTEAPTEEAAEAVEEAVEETTEATAEEAVEEVAEEAAEEATEEAAETAEAPAEEIAEEVAESEDEENAEIIVLPLEAAEDNEPDKDVSAAEDDGDDAPEAVDGDISTRFKESRFVYSYTSKLIQADDETKGYYSTVKNAFMSYKKVTCTVSREHERFRYGRVTVGIAQLRGKTVILYLALDPAQLENTMFVGADVSGTVKYADVPFQYRVNGPRKASRAVKLIAMVAEKFGIEAKPEPANDDYVALYPYETTEALIEKGIIIDKVADSARKAEEARAAAEEAEKAAEKAIEDAIKAQQSASAAAEKAAEKAEIHGEDTAPATEGN